MSTPTAAVVGAKAKREGEQEGQLGRPAIGLESEFTLVVDGIATPPETLFADPRDFLRKPMMHRVGSSYHLPNGGAVYFDTGVIEIVTPAIELERGAPTRAGRSLWEGIEYVRAELDGWQRRHGRRVQLAGFSTHFNVSIDAPRIRQLDRLARLLTFLLPAPIMLLAANKRSTGIGVRPRVTRIEVTADFTPDPALQIAAATFIAGVVRETARWPAWSLYEARRRDLPVIAGFAPIPHTSRKGWLARQDCYPRNPFQVDPNAAVWVTTEGQRMSLRDIARRIFVQFRRSIARIADPFTFRLIAAVLAGRATSLLDLPDRPATYDDVGKLCRWREVFPERYLRRSRYERVLMHAIAGNPVYMDGTTYIPDGMRGWSRVVLRRVHDRATRVVSVDTLVPYLTDPAA